MKPLLREMRRGLALCDRSPGVRAIAVLTVGLAVGGITSTSLYPASVAAAGQDKSDTTQAKLPPWERRPKDLRAAVEENKLALQLITAVFEARVRRGEAELKFQPSVVAADKYDPLSGPNDLAGSPLLQDFSQGAVWLSVILTANQSELSPRLQQVQRGLLEGLQQEPRGKPGAVKKEIKKPIRTKELTDSDTAGDIQRVLTAERNYQEVLTQLRSAFPQYAELYLHQSPRVLNRPGEPTVFELCDPVINADPLVKGERMQASIIVKVYRYDEHSYRIVSFWLYRTIEDPAMFVPRQLYSDKGRDLTRNSAGLWDGTHMPPRTFSAMAYVSQPVTVITLKFVDGEPVIAGRSAPAGRRRAQPADLTKVSLNQLEPAGEGVLDASVPSFPVSVPDIPTVPPLALSNPRPGRDYMPRIREPYEFLTQAEYEAYLAGMQEALAAMQEQPRETAEARLPARTQPATAVSVPAREPPLASPAAAASVAMPAAELERLIPIFLNPQQQGGLSELSARARESLKQYPDLQRVSTHNMVNLLFEKSNVGLRSHDRGTELLRQKLPRVPEMNVYFLASENTNATWRGPDESSGKGGIVVILPTRYYFDPQQFYKQVASALINQPVTSEEVATLSSYLGGAAAQPAGTLKQFAIETDYLDHGWDEDGNMRRWADEAVDFFKHLQEAMQYLKPRLETMTPEKRASLEPEIAGVESWLTALGDASVTVNFGLYKGKNDAPAPKADAATRTIWINCRAEEYIQSEQREYRWALLAKLIEGFNGLKGGSFDRGMTGAVYDILEDYARDKDNKLMIGFRLKTDLPDKPADWPMLAGVPRGATTVAVAPQAEPSQVAGDPAGSKGATPIVAQAAAEGAREQQRIAEVAPALDPPAVAAKTGPPLPQLEERKPEVVQATKSGEVQWADPAFGKQVSGLISSQMKGVDDSSLRAKILQTMVDRLIIVRDSNPNFHSKVSSIDLREPNPKHFDLTVNKTEYFDALFTLSEKDGKARDVIWSTFEANEATVEYAAGNHDFGPLYTTLQSDLTGLVKRHTSGQEVSQEIFSDPEFKGLLPYYTTFWSNWQFAGERARFQYLHDHVTSKGLRQLANDAGKKPDTSLLKAALVRLADEVDMFYGESVQVASALPAVESNAGGGPNSLDTVAIRAQASRDLRESQLPASDRPEAKPDYNFTQVISILQKVQQPEGQRSQYQDSYRRAFVIYMLLDAWNRMDPGRQKKVLAGEWAGADLRFTLAILAEIHAKKLSTPLDNSAIVKLSLDMPWIADPKFDVAKGAFGKLPETLKQTP